MTQSKPSIAIVEDDSDQLHSIEEFLLDSGYSVWGAGSAEAFYKGFTVCLLYTSPSPRDS